MTAAPLWQGVCETLSPRVRRIIANNPGVMTAAGTNTYLVGCRELAIVDAGPADDAHVAAILAAVADASVRWLVVTHTHPDHSPAVALLRSALRERGQEPELIGAMLVDDGHQDSSFVVESSVQHGDLLCANDFVLEAVATPGHVGNHICYFLREEAAFFTGDHIIGGSSVVIIPPSGDMADYLASLQRLKDYPLARLYPGHGAVIDDPLVVIDGLIAHRLRREAKVLQALRTTGECSLKALTPIVYDDVDPALHPVAQVSLWAHLLKLQKDGKARRIVEQHWLFGEERWLPEV